MRVYPRIGIILLISQSIFSPVYFAVIVNTSTAQAGLIISLCGGLGLALGSLIAGQSVASSLCGQADVYLLILWSAADTSEAAILGDGWDQSPLYLLLWEH